MPSTRSTTDVAAFVVSAALVLNGNSTASSVASPTIQLKNVTGRGVLDQQQVHQCGRDEGDHGAASTKPVVCTSP